MILRNYKSGDETEIFNLIKTVLAGYGLQTNPVETDKDILDIQMHYIDKGGCFKVIEADDRIIGSYGLYVIDDQVCELRKMYLLSKYQGQKLGKMMMDDALECALSLGFREMVLESNTRLDKAIKLYENYGFVTYNARHLSDRCDVAMKRHIK